jgi:hypothetical protein
MFEPVPVYPPTRYIYICVLETLTCLSKSYTRSSSWRPPLSLIPYPHSVQLLHRPPLQHSTAPAAHRPPLGRSSCSSARPLQLLTGHRSGARPLQAPGGPGVQHSSSRRPGVQAPGGTAPAQAAPPLGRSAAPAVSTAVPRCGPVPRGHTQEARSPAIQTSRLKLRPLQAPSTKVLFICLCSATRVSNQ